MAKSSKRRRGGSGRAETAPGKDAPDDGGGHDWGWPSPSIVLGTTGLLERFAQGGFTGCGYGLLSHDGSPFLALMGERMEGMLSGLALLREWVDAAGPNALRIEILYDDPGYLISISPQRDLLAWRMRGLDSVADGLMMSVSIVKRFDTRHPNLDQLAEYARHPVAPVLLTVARIPSASAGRSGWSGTAAIDTFARNGILLPGIDVYMRPEDRPPDSMIRLTSEIPTGERRPFPPQPDVDPAAIASRRDKRLLAAMPKTMHVLRHVGVGRSLVSRCAEAGIAGWQVEQAACNIRLPQHLAYQPRGRSKRAAMLEEVRRVLVEPASVPVDLDVLTPEAILEQVSLDAAFLLRRLEPEQAIPDGPEARSARLRELGLA